MWCHRACYSRRQQRQAALKGETGVTRVAGQWSHPRGTLSPVTMQEKQRFHVREQRATLWLPAVSMHVRGQARKQSQWILLRDSRGSAGTDGTDGTQLTQGQRVRASDWIQVQAKGTETPQLLLTAHLCIDGLIPCHTAKENESWLWIQAAELPRTAGRCH